MKTVAMMVRDAFGLRVSGAAEKDVLLEKLERRTSIHHGNQAVGHQIKRLRKARAGKSHLYL